MSDPIPTINCAGVIVDFETRTIAAGGRQLPVTAVMYSSGNEERMRDPNNEWDMMVLDLMYAGRPEKRERALRRPVPAMPESCHFNVLCENGWWVEVALWPEEDAMSCGLLPGGVDGRSTETVDDLFRLLAEAGRQQTYESSDEYDNPWCGMERGGWAACS